MAGDVIRSTDKVKPLSIEKYLGKVRNRVYRVGVELEGGWNKLHPSMRLTQDTSVFKNPSEHDLMMVSRLKISKVGELPSHIMVPGQMSVWVKNNYPHYVNHTCGLHIHMSFDDLRNYSRLMVPEYQSTMVEYIGRWAEEEELPQDHPIWNRLAGKNEFCNKGFWAEHQVMDTRKDYDHFRAGNRYTMVAYRYGTHKTIECRLLPMMEKADQGVRALRRVLDITNACLVVLARKEQKFVEYVDGKVAEAVVERDVEFI